MGQPKEDATICKVCNHDMGRSRCKVIKGGWTVRCNKCKTHYDIIVVFPDEAKKNMTAKQNPFKPGDTVRCIDDSGDGHKLYLVHGHEYQVSDVSALAGEPQVILNVPYKNKTWYAKRFEKVSP